VLFGHVIQVFNYKPQAGGPLADGAGALIRGLFNAEGAVLLFFVLSGCVLAMSLERLTRFDGRIIAGFYIKRVFRLYPLLWVSTFIAIAGVLAVQPVIGDGIFASWLQVNLQAPVTLGHTLLSMAGVYTKYDGPMWSLRVELIYSALFPAIYLVVRQPRLRPWFLAALLALALLPVAHPQYGTAFGISFGLGALIPLLPRQSARPHGLIVAAALAMLCYDRTLLNGLHPPEIVYDLIETIASFVIVRDVHAGQRHYRLLGQLALIRIGDLSFSVYLLHLPILLMIFMVLRDLAGSAALLGHPALTQIGLGLATAAATLALSCVTYYVIESPLHHVGRRLAGRVSGKRRAMANIEDVTAGLTPAS
jgi:peptidoglycan/LPS O-acetylase OafA/YrhL